MKVECDSCGAKLNLPDDKLEPGSDFSFNCPKCKHKNSVRVPEANGAGPATPSSLDMGEDEAGLDEFYEEGAKLALVCFDDGPRKDHLVKTIEGMGYQAVIPNSPNNALERMRLHRFDVILLDENFAGLKRENNTVLRFIQPMEMAIRRRMFVALFGDFQSLDNMTAYVLSVNMVVSMKDEDQWDKIIYRGLSEYERFYKVFFDVLREMGKA